MQPLAERCHALGSLPVQATMHSTRHRQFTLQAVCQIGADVIPALQRQCRHLWGRSTQQGHHTVHGARQQPHLTAASWAACSSPSFCSCSFSSAARRCSSFILR